MGSSGWTKKQKKYGSYIIVLVEKGTWSAKVLAAYTGMAKQEAAKADDTLGLKQP